MSLVLFKPLENEKSEYGDGHYIVSIQNIYVSQTHFGSKKDVLNFLDDVYSLSREMDTFEKNLVLHSMDIFKGSDKVENIKFFRDGDNKIIVLVYESGRSFGEFPPFSREFSVFIKDRNLTYSVIEFPASDQKKLEKGEIKLPETWKIDESMQKRLSRLRDFL